jgi:hypothetical protein
VRIVLNDRDALQRAFATARKDSKQLKWTDGRLAAGQDWESVARSCACHCQSVALDLMPWQMPPISYFNANDPDSALRQPYGDPRGAREAVEILHKLLALGLSRYEPHPLQAIQQAEARRTAK